MNCTIEIENIAGISEGIATVESGVNTVKASNWQGKSSFIRAIETAFGTKTALTEGEDEGHVAVDIDGERHEVRLDRSGGTVARHGNPVLEDEYDRLVADLFAFLGEDNAIRQAVRNGDNLAPLLTKPLEVSDINERIADLREERDAVEIELAKARASADDLVSLRKQKNTLESELADLREQEQRFDDAMASDAREELSDLRAERQRVSSLIERLENTIERAQEKLTDTHEEYESIEAADPADVEDGLAEVRDKHEQAEQDLELLQSVYSANKRLVEEERLDLLTDVDHGLLGDAHTCWLCGSETTADEIESQLDAVGAKVLDLREEARMYEERIEELESKRDDIREQQRRKTDLEDRITELESTVSERSQNLSSAKQRLETVEEQIAELETEVEDVDREISDIRSDIKYKEAELEDVVDDIQAAEQAATTVETLEAEKEQLSQEITQLRTRKDEIQTRIRTEFDNSISTIVSMFETSFESARLTSEFELVVARDGREVGLNALSEGEVELIGLVTAVAGFEAYDVDEVTPVMLLDQLGGLADANLETLADYLDGRTESLVLTAYPENSTFGDHRIDPAEWTVIVAAQSAGV
jgi:predicted  nucleic acid-binding Zn-ribbon protein